MNNSTKIAMLQKRIYALYEQKSDELLFHGWHHIAFVQKKALEFARNIGADLFLVESAALTHDLNYIVKINSIPEAGAELRKSIFVECGYSNHEVERIERIILESHTANRDVSTSIEGKALSDADTLFKSLPITPILFSSKYIAENEINIQILANKIISEQIKLLETGIYFYTDEAKDKYLQWAITNLNLWKSIEESLRDPDVVEMLKTAKDIGAL